MEEMLTEAAEAGAQGSTMEVQGQSEILPEMNEAMSSE